VSSRGLTRCDWQGLPSGCGESVGCGRRGWSACLPPLCAFLPCVPACLPACLLRRPCHRSLTSDFAPFPCCHCSRCPAGWGARAARAPRGQPSPSLRLMRSSTRQTW
jgi:hypothetical protein